MDLSVVIPVYNEEQSIPHLYKELTRVMRLLKKEYEIIAVDDGSRDGTYKELKKFHEKDKKFKVISFRRNFGQTAALSAGFDHAKGKIIVAIDADLENDPADIPRLLNKIEEGYDVVSGWRSRRWEGNILRRLPSKTANYLLNRISGLDLHDTGCTLKAYRKDVLDNIRLYGEMHRFIPSLAVQVGARVTEVKVNFRPRRFGSSKYGFSRTLRVFLDLILLKFLLGYSNRPIHIFGSIGVISGVLGGFILLYLSYLRLFLHQSIGGRPLLLLGILMVVLSAQFIMMGILGEVAMRTYYESQDKKTYIIRDKLL